MRIRLFVGLSLVFGFLAAHAEDVTQVPALQAKQKVQFSHSGFRSSYSCSYVEGQTKKILKALGAQEIKVRCSGGLESRSETVFIRAQFLALHETTEEKSTQVATILPVKLKFKESCSLHKTIVDQLLKKFEVYTHKEFNNCYDWQGRVEYDLTVLK